MVGKRNDKNAVPATKQKNEELENQKMTYEPLHSKKIENDVMKLVEADNSSRLDTSDTIDLDQNNTDRAENHSETIQSIQTDEDTLNNTPGYIKACTELTGRNETHDSLGHEQPNECTESVDTKEVVWNSDYSIESDIIPGSDLLKLPGKAYLEVKAEPGEDQCHDMGYDSEQKEYGLACLSDSDGFEGELKKKSRAILTEDTISYKRETGNGNFEYLLNKTKSSPDFVDSDNSDPDNEKYLESRFARKLQSKRALGNLLNRNKNKISTDIRRFIKTQALVESKEVGKSIKNNDKLLKLIKQITLHSESGADFSENEEDLNKGYASEVEEGLFEKIEKELNINSETETDDGEGAGVDYDDGEGSGKVKKRQWEKTRLIYKSSKIATVNASYTLPIRLFVGQRPRSDRFRFCTKDFVSKLKNNEYLNEVERDRRLDNKIINNLLLLILGGKEIAEIDGMLELVQSAKVVLEKSARTMGLVVDSRDALCYIQLCGILERVGFSKKIGVVGAINSSVHRGLGNEICEFPSFEISNIVSLFATSFRVNSCNVGIPKSLKNLRFGVEFVKISSASHLNIKLMAKTTLDFVMVITLCLLDVNLQNNLNSLQCSLDLVVESIHPNVWPMFSTLYLTELVQLSEKLSDRQKQYFVTNWIPTSCRRLRSVLILLAFNILKRSCEKNMPKPSVAGHLPFVGGGDSDNVGPSLVENLHQYLQEICKLVESTTLFESLSVLYTIPCVENPVTPYLEAADRLKLGISLLTILLSPADFLYINNCPKSHSLWPDCINIVKLINDKFIKVYTKLNDHSLIDLGLIQCKTDVSQFNFWVSMTWLHCLYNQ
ncbi:hypothetical protein AX774_g3582 [Zancudomyces culisetae]|uniref:Uncharacterized protein n=1 Tax=Zancudomyces culisetae TaxID=1213189 RepID=A0A1R1PPN1_ZANCU|nr:hypothetical protein AX774_g3582 [Zancudomyces culisetae]|eukprot:OMH82924.1 hypothetical protein AX774_g3582 [Zancudomyces culisetae]